jgi:hypothetical protein
MSNRLNFVLLILFLSVGLPLFAQGPSVGAGNATAAEIARESRIVNSAMDFLVSQAKTLKDSTLRSETLDAINNPHTCIEHRSNLSDAGKNAIITALKNEGLVRLADDGTFPGGLKGGVFPPVVNDGSSCPQLPQPFYSAPGSVFHGHHSYPGGLPVHETNNDIADVHLAGEYVSVYGGFDGGGFPAVSPGAVNGGGKTDPFIDMDIITAAPIWHDWGKIIVFQWNADGTEFPELNFGGNGLTDNFGAAGDSTTGGHHIIGVAESMKRGLSPDFVITQASAHSAPTSGNEYKVVNWLRAAAIIAQIDPIAAGYLTKDGLGHYRLPALRKLGEINFLATSPSQTNALVEYELHNLSDADFTFSGPSLSMVETILAQLAPEFGYSPASAAVYNIQFRNRVLSSLTAEQLQIIYANDGVQGVREQLQLLRKTGHI